MGAATAFRNSTSSFHLLDGSGAFGTTDIGRAIIIAEAGTLSNLRVNVDLAAGASASWIFTVHVNAVASALTCTIGGASDITATNTADDVAVVAGDVVSMVVTKTGTPSVSTNYQHALDFEATAANRAIWGGVNGTTPATGATHYGQLGGTGQDDFANTVEATAALLWSINATITSLYIKLFAAPGAGDTRAFTIMQNGLAVGDTVTIADLATTGNATGMSIVIAPGDTLSLRNAETGTPADSGVSYGIAYAPTIDGQWNISGKATADYTNGQFTIINLGITGITSTELDAIVLGDAAGNATKNWRIGNLRVSTGTSPSGSETRTYTLKISGASSTVSAVITGVATTGSSTTIERVNDGSTLGLLLNKSASAAGSTTQRWAFLAMPAGGIVSPPGGGGGPNRPPGGRPNPPGGGGSGLTGPVLKKLRFPEKVI